MQLGSMPDVMRHDTELAAQRLARLEGEARSALDRMRGISRNLRPPVLDELGLPAAIVELGRSLGVRVNAKAETSDLPPGVEVAAYRIAAEALVNAQRHAGVDEVDLQLLVVDASVEVRVSDRGPGLGDATAGVGMTSMRERAAELGGTLRITDRAGGGIVVLARLPLRGAVR